MTETKALRQLKQGSADALKWFISKYTPYVSTIIYNIIGSSMSVSDTEEVASDVFFALWENADKVKSGSVRGYLGSIARNKAKNKFREAGFEIGDTESPIIPLYVRDTEKTFAATMMAFEEGVFINPVIPPACAPQDTLVRVALMATHTKEQVDTAVEKLAKVFRELGVIQ